jgi:hypothetical protein
MYIFSKLLLSVIAYLTLQILWNGIEQLDVEKLEMRFWVLINIDLRTNKGM